mgnify:CR=1 FL=1
MSTGALVRIEHLGGEGDGIGTLDGRRLAVPLTCPGDLVAVGRHTGSGRLARELAWRLVEAAPRRPPQCPHRDACGGCVVQHLPEPVYRAFKQARVAEPLVRQGVDPAVIAPVVASPPGSRRRARLAWTIRRGRVTLGFRERRGRAVVDLEACAVLRPALVALLPGLRELAAATGAPLGEAVLSETATGIDVLLVSDAEIGWSRRERLAAIAGAAGLARLSLGPAAAPEPLVTHATPRVTLSGHAVAIPPGAFLQATAEGEAALVDAVRGWLDLPGPVADLYAGCGTFALALLERGPVRAFERDAAALDAARRAAHGRLAVEVRDLDRQPLSAEELRGFAAVVLDPPHRGAAAQIPTLASAPGPVRIAYVSCHPGSFARDVAGLAAGGWRLVRVVPVDQFLWSAEIELVGLLERR